MTTLDRSPSSSSVQSRNRNVETEHSSVSVQPGGDVISDQVDDQQSTLSPPTNIVNDNNVNSGDDGDSGSGSGSLVDTSVLPSYSKITPKTNKQEPKRKMNSYDEELLESCNMISAKTEEEGADEEEKEGENKNVEEPKILTFSSSPPSSTPQRKQSKFHDSIKSNLSTYMIEYYRGEYSRDHEVYRSWKWKRPGRKSEEDEVDSCTAVVRENQPSKARWKQQKMPAWQPVYQPIWTVVSFCIVGLLVTATGVVMLNSTLKTSEYVYDYTHCESIQFPNKTCASLLLDHPEQKCSCWLEFTLPHEFLTPLFLYYGLRGFYQNHRRYRQSVDWDQLKGLTISVDQAGKSCAPYGQLDGRVIAPCGMVANSLFTDTFRFYALDGQTKREITLLERNISWSSDAKFRFKNPITPDPWSSVAKPENWSTSQWVNWGPNGGYTNEHFIVWMRTATFTEFRKLWARVDWGSVSPQFGALPSGTYAIEVDYHYRTVFPKLTVQKEIILANTSWLGGRNLFLPVIYLVTGVLVVFASAFLLWVSVKYRNREMEPLTRKTPYTPDLVIPRLP